MANNRLYILDTETGKKCLLAKSYGNKWSLWSPDELEKWLDGRDLAALDVGGKTKLKLVTE